MSTSRLDAMYRSILITKFFTKGWGKPENLKRLFEFRKVVSNRDECFKLVDRDYPVTITKEQTLADCRLFEGYFITPLEKYLPGIVPEVAQKAHFQAMLPIHWQDPKCKPVCLHLAGTGDHFFWRRRNLMVKPLLKEAGIGGIILENPFYGLRKPIDQVRSSLHNVSDIFVMGGCLILESLVMFHWCERNGFGPLGVTGLSMGGHMASLAATNWPKPLVLVPCLSWSTASAVFLQGVMAHSINWDLLEDQYLSDGVYREKLSKMVTIIDEAFLAGKKFARSYSQNINKQAHIMTHLDTTSEADKLDITYKESTKTDDKNGRSIESKTNVHDSKVNVDNSHQTEVKAKNHILESNPSALNAKQLEKTQENLSASNHCRESSSNKFALKKDLVDALLKLLNEKQISKELFDKLNSNEKFMLHPDDIEVINNINEKEIKDLLIKSRIGDVNDFAIDSSQGATIHTIKAKIESEPLTVNSIRPKFTKSDSEIEKDETSKEPKSKPEKKSWNVSDLTSDLWTNLPFVRSSGKKIDINKIHWRDREALQFMRGIMDECTHLSNFSVPFDTSLIIAVCASHDAYVPRDDVGTLEEIWPGAEVRYVDAGHVSAYLLHQSLFRSCIKEAFERSKKKWKNGKHIC